jgi:HEAT repeat protein
MLDDEPPGLRAKAAAALGAVGPAAWRAVPRLVEMLGDPVAWVAGEASRALGRVGAPALPALVEVFEHEDARVVEGALAAVVEMGEPGRDALPALVCALERERWEARWLALLALAGVIGPGDGDLIPQLVELTRDPSLQVQAAAQKVLKAMGPVCAPALMEMIATGSAEECSMATWALVDLQHEAAPLLPDLASIVAGKGEDHQREAACLVLQEVGADHPDVVIPALAAALRDTSWGLRWRAARALGKLGEPAVDILVEALDDGDPVVRRSAAKALGEMGEIAAPAIPALVEMLEHPAWQSQDAAAEALGAIGPAAADAAPLLLDRLATGPPVLATTSARALGSIGAPGSVEAILEGFGEADPTHGPFFPAALGFLGPTAIDAMEALVSMLEDPSPDVRSRAAWALGELGPSAVDAAPALAGAVEDGYMGFNVDAIESIGKIGSCPSKILSPLIHAMGQTGYSKVRAAAMRAALACGGKAKKVVPALIAALEDVQPEVKAEACLALAAYGPAAGKAVQPLVEVLDDPGFQDGQWAALRALEAIGPKAAKAAPAIISKLEVLSTREAAARALVAIGKPVVPAMIEALAEDRWRADEELARVLGMILRGETFED